MSNEPQRPPTSKPATPGDYPGKTLGLVGLILAIVVPLAGLIVSLVARKQSKDAGYANQLANIGVIIGVILTVLALISTILSFVVLAPSMGTSGY